MNCMPWRPRPRVSVASHGRFKVSRSYPTHPCIIDSISPLPFLCVTRAGDRVQLISTSPSIIGLCVVSERLSANLLRHISSEYSRQGRRIGRVIHSIVTAVHNHSLTRHMTGQISLTELSA